MRFILTGLFFLLINGTSYGQNEISLKGYLGIVGGESFHYKLIFKDSLGKIAGYSYTWQDEKKQVKAAIVGTLDKQEKILSFQETNIVGNTGFESNATICLIKATLRYKHDATSGGKVFSGAITSSDIGNVACATGSISIPYSEEVAAIFKANALVQSPIIKEEITTARKPQKPVKIIYDTSTVQYSTPKNTATTIEKITAGTDKQYEWSTSTIELDIWDGGKEDGDIISVEANGKMIWNNYQLVNAKKKISLALSVDEITTLKIIAHNEGNTPPNTANLLLTDGKLQYPLIAYNEAGGIAIIKIKKK